MSSCLCIDSHPPGGTQAGSSTGTRADLRTVSRDNRTWRLSVVPIQVLRSRAGPRSVGMVPVACSVVVAWIDSFCSGILGVFDDCLIEHPTHALDMRRLRRIHPLPNRR